MCVHAISWMMVHTHMSWERGRVPGGGVGEKVPGYLVALVAMSWKLKEVLSQVGEARCRLDP